MLEAQAAQTKCVTDHQDRTMPMRPTRIRVYNRYSRNLFGGRCLSRSTIAAPSRASTTSSSVMGRPMSSLRRRLIPIPTRAE
jgi:hypothetical protein